MEWYKYSCYLVLCCWPLMMLGLQSQPAAADLPAGQHSFSIHCAVCHGPKGEGGRGANLAVPKLIHASTEEEVIKVIRDGIPGTEMPESELQDSQIRQIAEYVLELGRRPAVGVPGDPRLGEQLYWTKGGCGRCHVIKGQGGALGPDLTDIGLRRGPAYLRTSLTDPEADVPKSFSAYRSDVSIPENFLQVRARTRDGRYILGTRINEDTFSIQVRDFTNRTYSFFKSELIELRKEWGKSPMPSYRDVFLKEELDDITAFLVSLRGEQ